MSVSVVTLAVGVQVAKIAGIQKKEVVVMTEKRIASEILSQFEVIYFLRSRLKFELTITKIPPRTPQMAPTMIELGMTSREGGEMSIVPNLRTDA